MKRFAWFRVGVSPGVVVVAAVGGKLGSSVNPAAPPEPDGPRLITSSTEEE